MTIRWQIATILVTPPPIHNHHHPTPFTTIHVYPHLFLLFFNWHMLDDKFQMQLTQKVLILLFHFGNALTFSNKRF